MKIKNLLKNIKTNKIFISIGTLFLIIFLFQPTQVLAFGWDTFINAVTGAIMFLPALFLLFVILISWGFASLTGLILDVIINPSFIPLNYTNPDHNQIIKSGLNITQSFVNMLLVLALVYIALSIALRINENQAKKMLVKLIIVALLVNFAPVLCGLVVDGSNITMNYFLTHLKGGVSSVLTQMGNFVDMLKSSIWNSSSRILNSFELIIMAVTQIILNFGIGIAFLLFAGLFLVRYVAIWILVILSPLAFICWALSEGPIPQVRKMWNMWLNNFIQWSIIGIPIAFFLYLSISSFTLMTTVFKAKIKAPQIGDTATTYFDAIFPYFVVLTFLFLGFIIGLSTSAMGASTIINAYNKKRDKVIGWTQSKAKNWAQSKANTAKFKLREWTSAEKFRKWGENRLTARKWGEKEPGIKGWGKRWARRTISAPIYYPARSISQRLGKSVIEGLDKKIQDKEKNLTGQSEITKLQDYHNALTNGEKIAILNSLIKEGQIDKVMDVNKFGKSAITMEEIQKLGNKAKKLNIEKDIIKAFPHLDLNSEKVKNTSIEEIKNRIKKMGPDIYSSISKEALKNTNTIDAILSTANGNNLKTLIDKHGETAINVIEERIKAGAPINPRLKRYLTVSPVGRTLLNIDLKEEKVVTKEREEEKVTETKIIPGTETEFKKTVEEEKNKPKGRQVNRRKKPPKGRRP